MRVTMRRPTPTFLFAACAAFALLPAAPAHADEPSLAGAAPAPTEGAPAPIDEAGSPPAEDPPPDTGRVPHPEPRVIVAVHKVRGPHDRGAVERAARLGWGRIVRCHKEASARGVQARGTIKLKLEVSAAGTVQAAKRVASELDAELSKCLVKAMRKVAMPRARRGSTVEASIRVAPGDNG